MDSLVPALILLDYLQEVVHSGPGFEERAKQFGYQKQLVYKHKDGAFSPFGQTNLHGIGWLTAQTTGVARPRRIDNDNN